MKRISILLFSMITISGICQQFPVSLSVYSTELFPQQILQYQQSSTLPFTVEARLNDLHSTSELVQLGMEIIGPNLQIRSAFPLNTASIQLFPGETHFINTTDLSSLFQFENIDSYGAQSVNFIKNGLIPEGIYQLYINVYDAVNDRKLSESIPITFSIILEEPPVLIFPDQEVVQELENTPLIIRWLPRHSTMNFTANLQLESIRYRIELIELQSNELPSDQQFNLQIPLLSEETDDIYFVYDLQYPPLESGKWYALRIRAFAPEETIRFRNDGISQVLTFRWGTECSAPERISIPDTGPDYVTLSWEPTPSAQSYDIEFKNNSDTTRYFENSGMTFHKIASLIPEEYYEFRLRAACPSSKSEFSPWISKKLPTLTAEDFFCGNFTTPPLPDSLKLEKLSPGDLFYISDFEVSVVESFSDGNFTFSGKGTMPLPFFNKARVTVEFTEIELDQKYRLKSGAVKINQIEPVWADKVDEWLDKTDDLIAKTEETITIVGETYDSLKGIIQAHTESNTLSTDTTNQATNLTSNSEYTAENSTSDMDSVQNTHPISDSTQATSVETSSETGATTETEPINTNSAVISSETSGLNSTSSTNSTSSPTNFPYQTSASLNEKQILAGPLTFNLSNLPESENYNNQGHQVFKNIQTNFNLSIKDLDYQSDLIIENALISFEKDTLDEVLHNILVEWQGKQPISPIGWLELTATNISFTVSNDGNITGKITILPQNKTDAQLYQQVQFNDQPIGNAHFIYDKSVFFEGMFDWGDVVFPEITLLNTHDKTQTFQSIKLDESGRSMIDHVQFKNIEINADSLEVFIESLEYAAILDIKKGLQLQKGHLKGEIRSIPYFEGKWVFDQDFTGERLLISPRPEEVTFFTMRVSEGEMNLELSKNLAPLAFTSNMTLEHPFLDGTLKVEDYTYSKGIVESINMHGEVKHNGLRIELIETTLEEGFLVSQGLVEYEYQSQLIQSHLKNFKISKNGNITPGEYEVTANLTAQFGPYKVLFDTKPVSKGKENGYDIYQDVKATLFFTDAETEKETKIAGVNISYKEDSQGKWKEFIAIAKSKSISLGTIGPFEGFVEALQIEIDNSIHLEVSGTLDCKGKVSQDISLNNLIGYGEELTGLNFTLKKGAESDFDLLFQYQEGLLYLDMKVKNIRNLDLRLHKGKQPIASLLNFSFYEDGRLKGRLQSLVDAEYSNSGVTVALDEMDLDFELYPFREHKDFKFTKGKIRFKVSDITGMTGKIVFEAQVDEKNIITRVIDNYNDIKFHGLTISDLKLSLMMDAGLNIERIYGSFAAKHKLFDSGIEISEFNYEKGEITKLTSVQTRLKYQHFLFELNELSYLNKELSFNAQALLNLSTGEANKLEVNAFKIDSLGTIFIGEINGKIVKNPVLLDFNAKFGNKRFTGSFTGEFGSYFNMKGQIDVGAEDTYQFGYLALTSSANIPLGPAFKISQLGGSFGFNYNISYDEHTKKFKGYPRKDQYVAGLGIGIADVAGAMELYGNPIIQFGASDVKLNLYGSLSIPRNNPNYFGELYAEYNFTKEILRGSLHSNIMLPAQ
ncbi:MAG: hypothetical protein OEW75_07760, partial [Cyclobacteriaceae bacterium]|nr:hypothetical protein [Cyclobacteriaceae bacterium]